MSYAATARWFPGTLDERARRTFAMDCLRQFCNGLIDTGPKTFFLLIAVRHFSAGDFYNSLISAPSSVGMLLSVAALPYLAGFVHRKIFWLAWARLLTGCCYLVAAWKPELRIYATWIFIAGLPASVAYPLLTGVYQENYPRALRGQLFAWASMVNMVASAVFSFLWGHTLGANAEHYQSMLIAFAVASFLAAWAIRRMPETNQTRLPRRSFIHAFKWVRQDKAFAYMLGVWFVFGFGVIMVSPLKVIYLTAPRYGQIYTTAEVALIVGFLPESFRILTTPMWARFFDRHHFVGIRMALNLIIPASLVAFFIGRTKVWLCAAAALEGMSTGGSGIAWALWVTHVAPEGHVTEYMSINQFFTGIRGVIGTFLGIRLASQIGLEYVAWGTISLVVISILMMLPLRGDKRWRASPEITDTLPGEIEGAEQSAGSDGGA